MKIKFKCGTREFILQGATHDFELLEFRGTKEVKGEIKELTTQIGYFGNPFQALSYIPDYNGLKSDATSFKNLSEEYKQTLSDIKEIAKQFREV